MSLQFNAPVRAEAPTASFIFPPGGQRGQTVQVRVGGLFLNKSCGFEMLGPGVEATPRLARTKTLWFEGPLLPLPDSQQAEDYPRDLAGTVKIAADASVGMRPWRLWTSQGATPSLKFVVGDLPEIIEAEIEGQPVPTEVKLPVTINGRIFPRENVDVWSFMATKGQSVSCEVCAARLGSPLDSRIEVRDPEGRVIAENDDYFGADSFLRFTAPMAGRYEVRIHDVNFRGGPAYVYRLTLTSEPRVETIFPLGGKRGTAIKFELTGQRLPADPLTVALPADAPRDYAHRLTVDGKLTNPFVIETDDLPEFLKGVGDQAIAAPCVLNGRIAKAGDADSWNLPLRKGDACEFEVRAQRLGSPLCAVLSISDEAGKELARAEGGEGGQLDPLLRFTPPADGTYSIRIGERFRARGGPDHAYRLRITTQAMPDFSLGLAADALTVPRNGQGKFKLVAQRQGNFTDAIALEFVGLPAGVTVSPTSIPAKQSAADLVFKADANAKIDVAKLTIRGSAKIGEQMVQRTATLSQDRDAPEMDNVLLAVALPTPFKIVGDFDMRWGARGTVQARHYRIERNGFAGPIEIALADRQMRHLQGVTAAPITVPADADQFDYTVHLPPWMETGRTCRVCVMGTATIKDADGSEHDVTYSSVQANEQFIFVVEPEKLSLNVERHSLAVQPGGSVSLPLQVGRGKGLHGAVKVEAIVPAHFRGISAPSVDIAADGQKTTLTFQFAADARGPFNSPVVIRATLLDNGKPIIAETKVELQKSDGK